MSQRFPRSRLQACLLGVWALVVLLGAGAEVASRVRARAVDPPWLPFLSLSYEGNLPTWLSAALLAAGAASLVRTGRAERRAGRGRAGWTVLGVALGVVAADEVLGYHERMGAWFHLDGVLYFGWVLPAAAAVLVLGLCLLPFLRSLPPRTRRGFLLSGVLYLTGALAMELPLGAWTSVHGPENLTYALLDHLEEALEMLGAIVLLLVLVAHREEEARQAAGPLPAALSGEGLRCAPPPPVAPTTRSRRTRSASARPRG